MRVIDPEDQAFHLGKTFVDGLVCFLAGKITHAELAESLRFGKQDLDEWMPRIIMVDPDAIAELGRAMFKSGVRYYTGPMPEVEAKC